MDTKISKAIQIDSNAVWCVVAPTCYYSALYIKIVREGSAMYCTLSDTGINNSNYLLQCILSGLLLEPTCVAIYYLAYSVFRVCYQNVEPLVL